MPSRNLAGSSERTSTDHNEEHDEHEGSPRVRPWLRALRFFVVIQTACLWSGTRPKGDTCWLRGAQRVDAVDAHAEEALEVGIGREADVQVIGAGLLDVGGVERLPI